MGVYYLDTSALVKRYALEAGTTWVAKLTDRAAGHDLYTVRLTGPEMIAALFRKVRGGGTSLVDTIRAASTFRSDWQEQYEIVELTIGVADRAMTLVEKHSLRGYDAVHLAAAVQLQETRRAMELSTITFVSADEEQLQAANDEGLLTVNPNTYP